MKLNTIYMHKNAKDICFEIVQILQNNNAKVIFYNYNYHKISGLPIRHAYLHSDIVYIKDINDFKILPELHK